jgi:hypothetical protein
MTEFGFSSYPGVLKIVRQTKLFAAARSLRIEKIYHKVLKTKLWHKSALENCDKKGVPMEYGKKRSKLSKGQKMSKKEYSKFVA